MRGEDRIGSWLGWWRCTENLALEKGKRVTMEGNCRDKVTVKMDRSLAWQQIYLPRKA